LSVVASRGGGLLGKIAYRNNKAGIELIDVGPAAEFKDELLERLGETFSISEPIVQGASLRYDIGSPEVFRIIFQPTSNTTGRPSIVFRTPSNHTVKMRF